MLLERWPFVDPARVGANEMHVYLYDAKTGAAYTGTKELTVKAALPSKGISGLEVTKWIKEDDDLRTIPIIAVTAFAMKGDEEKIREGGCEAYIAKPISVANFLETVERFLS